MKKATKIRLSFIVGFTVIIIGSYFAQIHYPSQKTTEVMTPTKLPEQQTSTTAYSNFDSSAIITKAMSSPVGTILKPKSKKEIADVYKDITMIEIPHIFIDELPSDWSIESTADKTLFMKIITALILRTNEQILNERAALRLLQEKRLKKLDWNEQETAFFNYLVEKYDAVLKKNDSGKLADLIEKVDIIPPSLAVAQAIMFTNWGRKHQKALYGEYGWLNEESYEPIQFDSLTQATDSFALQLNARSQMLQFREIRRRLIPYERIRELGTDLLDNMTQFMNWDPDYVSKLAHAYGQGLIKELDHACFKGTCELIDNSIEFE